MISYKWIEFDNDEAYDKWDSAKDLLDRLIQECQFIVTNYNTMHPTTEVKGVGDSLRGPTIEYADGNMDYFYSVAGGWKKDE